MRWKPCSVNRLHSGFCHLALPLMFLAMPFAMGTAFAAAPPKVRSAPSVAEMSFTKGDTRDGSRIHIRVAGDSLFYHETIYSPGAAPTESRKTLYLHGFRRRALLGVMGELPRYPTFGSCYGKDMRFYMVETQAGKFYRSLPERAGKCYVDEPGIWSLFQDLDDLVSPPREPEYLEYSAS